MKYTIYFDAYLTHEIMHKADALNIGMIEEVLEHLVSWHHLYMEEIPTAISFIRENYGNITIRVAEEYWYDRCNYYDLDVMEIKLDQDGNDEITEIVNKSMAESILRNLRNQYKKADALYMHTIIDAVTEAGFWILFKYKLIEYCGILDGEKLYAI